VVINTNITAQAAASQLGQSSRLLAQSLARLASGSKLLSPEDDAAGLAVSMRFDAQSSRTSATLANLGNATSFTQTQDGYLQQIGNALDRMSELAVQAQDATKTDSDRAVYNKEFQSLAAYVNDAVTKDFNGVSLFSGNALNVTSDPDGGTFALPGISGNYIAGAPLNRTLGDLFPGYTFGIFKATGPGVGNSYTTEDFALATLGTAVSDLNTALSACGSGGASYDAQTGKLSVTIGAGESLANISGGNNLLADLGLHDVDNSAGATPITMTSTPNAPDISTLSDAQAALATVKTGIDQLASDRGTVGANLTRLNYTTAQLGALQNSLDAASSRIKDVDVAQESTNYARYNILVQAGTAMLAQANSLPQLVLRLLG